MRLAMFGKISEVLCRREAVRGSFISRSRAGTSFEWHFYSSERVSGLHEGFSTRCRWGGDRTLGF